MSGKAIGFYTDEQGRKRPITAKTKRGYSQKEKTIKPKAPSKPEVICSICGFPQDDSWHVDCYADVNAEISDLASMGHDIDWTAKNKSDEDFLADIKDKAESVIAEVTALEKKMKEQQSKMES